MARVLRRPMFRIGGSTNEGITSGLAPRQGYANGELVKKAQEDAALMKTLAGQRPDTSLSQFMIDFGLDIASRPPQGSIFSTAAAAAKEPFQTYKASKAARGAYDQQIGLSAAQSTIAHRDRMLEIAMKNLSKDERIMMEKRAQLLADTLNISFAEAMKMELYKKREDPGEARKKGIEEMAMRMALEDDDSGIKYEYFLPIARQIQQAIDGVFDEEGEDPLEQISGRLDRAQKYIVEEDIGERQGDDTYGITQDRPEGDYIHNKVYFNPKDSNFYWYDNTKKQFNLVILGG
jgi:hypothetical protein